LLTCHSGELAVAEGLLKAAITSTPDLRQGGKIEASDMYLQSELGGRLHAGAVVRWCPAAASKVSPAGQSAAQRTALDDR
jgi:hypothetical protein